MLRYDRYTPASHVDMVKLMCTSLIGRCGSPAEWDWAEPSPTAVATSGSEPDATTDSSLCRMGAPRCTCCVDV